MEAVSYCAFLKQELKQISSHTCSMRKRAAQNANSRREEKFSGEDQRDNVPATAREGAPTGRNRMGFAPVPRGPLEKCLISAQG